MAERFHQAARDGNLGILREASRRDCNKLDEDGMTPTAWAAYHGNLEALRTIVGRGGNADVSDFLGYTALHHAAANGHLHCVSYLASFGANIWAQDNEHHTPLQSAALAERDEIVNFLDKAADDQKLRNKKVVARLMEKAEEDAEKNIKRYARLQEESQRRLEKEKRKMAKHQEIMDVLDNRNPPPDRPKGMKKLFDTIRGKKHDTVKSVGPRMYSEHFASTGTQRGRGGVQKGLQKKGSEQEFRVRGQDQSVRSLPGIRRDNQITYVKGQNKLNADMNGDSFTHPHSDSELAKLSADSGIGSDDYEDGLEPGLFNRPNFGKLAFIPKPGSVSHMLELPGEAVVQGDVVDARTAENGVGESDSIGSVGTLAHRLEKLPWNEEDLEPLDDEEEETEFSALELFLAAHNLTEFLPTFTKEKVDLDALFLLNEDDLIQMGLPLGTRRKIKDALIRRKDLSEVPGAIFDTHL